MTLTMGTSSGFLFNRTARTSIFKDELGCIEEYGKYQDFMFDFDKKKQRIIRKGSQDRLHTILLFSVSTN